MWIFQFPTMWIAHKLNKKGFTSLTVSRKIWTSIGESRFDMEFSYVGIRYYISALFFNFAGFWGGAVSLVGLGYLNGNKTAAVILYIISVTIGCCSNVGYNVNHMDLTPNYAGILMGLSNAVAATGGFGAPLIVSALVHDIVSENFQHNISN